jgi:hypothetical protein
MESEAGGRWSVDGEVKSQKDVQRLAALDAEKWRSFSVSRPELICGTKKVNYKRGKLQAAFQTLVRVKRSDNMTCSVAGAARAASRDSVGQDALNQRAGVC